VVPKFILPNLLTFERCHLALNAYIKIKVWKRLGKVSQAGLGKGMVYWLGKFRLVFLAILGNTILR
jgi:hypothetical protein